MDHGKLSLTWLEQMQYMVYIHCTYGLWDKYNCSSFSHGRFIFHMQRFRLFAVTHKNKMFRITQNMYNSCAPKIQLLLDMITLLYTGTVADDNSTIILLQQITIRTVQVNAFQDLSTSSDESPVRTVPVVEYSYG